MANPKDCSRRSRSDLISLLSQACEFEHGLACSYLFTSFTLKQEISEGLDWRQQQLVRRWANDIFVVAAEEMLHLAQVWNLLAAIGGNPYYWRPNFPVRSNYYPTGAPMQLTPFNKKTLETFLQYELPDDEREEFCKTHRIEPFAGSPTYTSVAQPYTIIREIIKDYPEEELFIGIKEQQVGEDLVDFPTLIKVVDRDSALAAIDLIKEQGEGAEPSKHIKDPLELLDVNRDGHHGVFLRVLREFEAECQRGGESTWFAMLSTIRLPNPVPTTELRLPKGPKRRAEYVPI